TIPSRTLSPRISTTVTVMSLLITMLSFFFLDSTSIGAYPFLRPEAVREVRRTQPKSTATFHVPARLRVPLVPRIPLQVLFREDRNPEEEGRLSLLYISVPPGKGRRTAGPGRWLPCRL